MFLECSLINDYYSCDVIIKFQLLPLSLNTWYGWPYYAWRQCIILSLNILNNILEKIMKIWYFENTHRDKSNDILYDIIYICILVEKYGQSKLGQNYIFSNESSIAGRRGYIITSVSNYKTLLEKKIVPLYNTPLLFLSTLIISLLTYSYLFYIFFFTQQ